MSNRALMVDAIGTEIIQRASYLEDTRLGSIYFGGGTPSLLTEGEMESLFECISDVFSFDEEIEITLEANPDDLSEVKLKSLADSPVNRLSIGIQSFLDDDLRLMNRVHSSLEAKKSLELAFSVGFDNISIDLIYGTPGSTLEKWSANLDVAFGYEVPHLSCYGLTVEPRTVLAHQVKNGAVTMPEDLHVVEQFHHLIDRTALRDFDHYEISNFCKPGFQAVHNTNYWRNLPYLGVGPSAHSFQKQTRSWNIANNQKYLRAIQNGTGYQDKEILTKAQIYNEYVMIGLRTKWGCDLKKIRNLDPTFATHFQTHILRYLEDKLIYQDNDTYILNQAGKPYADRIASDLFIV